MDYVTYNESGALTGGYCQELHVEHAEAYIEVSEDVRRDWVLYVANEARDGVELAPPVVTPLATLVSAFLKRVDADVDAIYAATMGNRTTEYTLAEADARAYVDAGYTGDVPASVQAWATAKSQTATWAADDILATAGNWRTAQAAIRAARLLRKEQARAALEALDAEVFATVDASWSAFVAYIRGALGLA